MKKIISLISVVTGILLAANSAAAITEELTGDTKLACEAILCLSSSHRPGECRQSLKRYFSIHHRKWHKTVEARKNFLKLCPKEDSQSDLNFLARLGVDKEDQKEKINSLTEALVRLPHECTAETLNKIVESRKPCRDCSRLYRIRPVLPQACQNYINHEWTKINVPIYMGDYSWKETYPTDPVWFNESDITKNE